jgi:hypothetical protein
LIRENPGLAARYFLQGSGQKVTDDALDRETRVLQLSVGQLMGLDPSSTTIGYMPIRGMEVYCRFLAANGVTTTLVPASAVVTNQFIAYANDFDHRAFIAHVKGLK